MLMLARELVRAGRCRNVLVGGGENRLSGQARYSAIQTLAQVGDAESEVPNAASVPAYYALLASRYMHETDLTQPDLAELAVLMRSYAMNHPDADLQQPITLDQVLASKPIAPPLKLLDCCPISDGAMALVDLDEGFRLLGHAVSAIAIGDRVVADHFTHGERTLVRFRPDHA